MERTTSRGPSYSSAKLRPPRMESPTRKKSAFGIFRIRCAKAPVGNDAQPISGSQRPALPRTGQTAPSLVHACSCPPASIQAGGCLSGFAAGGKEADTSPPACAGSPVGKRIDRMLSLRTQKKAGPRNLTICPTRRHRQNCRRLRKICRWKKNASFCHRNHGPWNCRPRLLSPRAGPQPRR